ncbi:MAG: hypothetical protein EP344_16925 [Bacteroidetes bacterium]|nr:MAG: hypothetical protein EP344_16925 [Bacteroidota bacterium]
MKKIIILLLFLAGIHILDACLLCQCNHVIPYFDFFTLQTETTAPDPGNQQPLEILVAPDSLEYLACVQPAWQLTPTAWGCTCEENGERGPKYPVTELTITADRSFKDSLPAGASLNHLFQLTGVHTEFPKYEPHQISQLQYWDYGFFPYGPGFLLRSEATPDSLGVPFRFTVTLVKSNGVSVSATTSAVQW